MGLTALCSRVSLSGEVIPTGTGEVVVVVVVFSLSIGAMLECLDSQCDNFITLILMPQSMMTGNEVRSNRFVFKQRVNLSDRMSFSPYLDQLTAPLVQPLPPYVCGCDVMRRFIRLRSSFQVSTGTRSLCRLCCRWRRATRWTAPFFGVRGTYCTTTASYPAARRWNSGNRTMSE